jgi:hypothetical protein
MTMHDFRLGRPFPHRAAAAIEWMARVVTGTRSRPATRAIRCPAARPVIFTGVGGPGVANARPSDVDAIGVYPVRPLRTIADGSCQARPALRISVY